MRAERLYTWSISHTLDVRPGDEKAVDEVEAWFLEYQEIRSPAIRERIILAHLGLADRLAAAPVGLYQHPTWRIARRPVHIPARRWHLRAGGDVR